jgi:chromosome segregation ATPase
MKQLKLQNLVLTNFKGIKHFELNADGMDMNIYGENATGKTTIPDGFNWLLFDKDSNNKKDFAIKTLVDGKPIHKLNHEVEATLLIDDVPVTLKKSFSERWTKKKGTATESFSGHTTKYFVDGVPVKKKEFEDKVKEIIPTGSKENKGEDIFKLLTSPSFFNEQLHWKDRRDLLLEVAGDVTDDEVLEKNKDLEKLAKVLNGRSIDDHKKVIAAKRKEINEELDRIPVRVDEIYRGLPDVTELNKTAIENDLQKAAADIEAKQEQINSIRSGSEVNKIKAEISDIDLKISNVKNNHAQEEQQQLYGLKAKLQEEQSNLGIIKSNINQYSERKNAGGRNIDDLSNQMNQLRKQYKDQDALIFHRDDNCVCPTCEQDLPEEKVEEAEANFNRNKSNLLEKINERGVELKNRVEELHQEGQGIQDKIDKLTEQAGQKAGEIAKIEEKIKSAESSVKPITENASYNKLMQERQALEQQIDALQHSVEESVQQVQTEIQSLKERQSALQVDQSKLDQSAQSHKRIAELEDEEKNLAAEYEKMEHELHLAEEFIRTKVNLLEEKINSKFKYARFNLFKTNINGGLEEICETTYSGVPYSSGLNNAARINVGLDIIETLSQHYGVQAPIFVDNAESVTQLIDIDSQVISLVVSAEDKQLRIENKSAEEVA